MDAELPKLPPEDEWHRTSREEQKEILDFTQLVIGNRISELIDQVKMTPSVFPHREILISLLDATKSLVRRGDSPERALAECKQSIRSMQEVL